MSQSNKKNRSKRTSTCNNKNSNNNSNNNKNSSDNNSNNNNSSSSSQNNTSKLCYFSSVDYIILASTVAIALGEELSSDDVNILASFFAVLSDELALIASIDVCNDGSDDSSVFVPPAPDVATTYSRNKNKKYTKKKK